MTIAQIVSVALPYAAEAELARFRVALVTENGVTIIEQQQWHRVRPRAGVRIVIRLLAGDESLAAVLQVVVSIAAVALGQYWALGLGFQAGTLGYGLVSGAIGLGVSVLGSMLVNALIPPQKPKDRKNNDTYTISGWQNRYEPNGVVPDVMGKIRYAPPFAAPSYTEIVGDIQYIRALFNFGYGPLSLTDFRLGDTSLGEYDEVEIEVREGLPGDLPISLYSSQVVEENVGAELARPKPRDDAGNIITGDAIETPVVRTTGADASGASVIIGFPAGLVRMNDEGKPRNFTVSILIEHRLVGATGWTEVATLDITAKKLEGLYRQHSWEFPSRGRYEVRLTRLTDEATSSKVQARSSWVALQTIRPEYPLNVSKPLALVALRVKATYQLNGQLDNFNALASRRCLDWNAGTAGWVERETSNPASLFRRALQSNANPKPQADAAIDLQQLQDWHDYCVLHDLKYDRVLEGETTLREVLAEIALAGRAAQRHDGIKWGVVIDRPQDLVVDHINPRNSWQFQASRTYFEPPHAFRVQFLDATNDYKPAERIVPWPGHEGEIDLTEAFELPGKTDPDEIWVEARRRMHEAIHRPDVYTCMQDGPARVATRGDLVMGSFDVLERTQTAGRVKSVSDNLVELDEIVSMDEDGSYAIRFRVFADEEDTIGVSTVRPVVTDPGERRAVVMTGAGAAPAAGEIVHFGPMATESLPLVVTRIEAGQDFSSLIRLVDAAPIIDELTDAEVPPAWSGRVGAPIDDNLLQPPAPRFTSVESGFAGTDTENLISVTLVPGSGPIATAQFTIEHRTGAGAWTPVTIPVANGGLDITGYTRGTVVEIRAFALSAVGIAGPVTPIVMITVGEDDADIPGGLDPALISIGALLGGAVAAFSTSDDARTTKVQLYRSATTVLNRATDAVGSPLAVLPSRSYSIPDGDTTRSTLIANGNMDSGASWTLGTGWSIGSGVASHAAGTASSLYQTCALVSGKWYRVAYTLSAVTAGSVFPRLGGGTARNGTTQTANGSYSDRIQAVTGNNFFAFVGLADFVGSADNAVLFEETATCLAAGTYYYWLEPQNADGLPGPLAGPFSVTIR
ncbi:MAG: phage tail protein [Rhizobium sp.]|nr:phage tail protein [Rhizobium sp.]